MHKLTSSYQRKFDERHGYYLVGENDNNLEDRNKNQKNNQETRFAREDRSNAQNRRRERESEEFQDSDFFNIKQEEREVALEIQQLKAEKKAIGTQLKASGFGYGTKTIKPKHKMKSIDRKFKKKEKKIEKLKAKDQKYLEKYRDEYDEAGYDNEKIRIEQEYMQAMNENTINKQEALKNKGLLDTTTMEALKIKKEKLATKIQSIIDPTGRKTAKKSSRKTIAISTGSIAGFFSLAGIIAGFVELAKTLRSQKNLDGANGANGGEEAKDPNKTDESENNEGANGYIPQPSPPPRPVQPEQFLP